MGNFFIAILFLIGIVILYFIVVAILKYKRKKKFGFKPPLTTEEQDFVTKNSVIEDLPIPPPRPDPLTEEDKEFIRTYEDSIRK